MVEVFRKRVMKSPARVNCGDCELLNAFCSAGRVVVEGK
jgi:hypothetical protein